MDCESMVTHFSVDEDDDGFIDYAQLEQNNEVQDPYYQQAI